MGMGVELNNQINAGLKWKIKKIKRGRKVLLGVEKE
jgi:hypothetical protein